jgi:hypothetical protein
MPSSETKPSVDWMSWRPLIRLFGSRPIFSR